MEKFNINFQELEFKYSADDISFIDFNNFIKSLNPQKQITVSSWDYYYSGGANLPFEFLRYREGEKPELTVKLKTNEKNNTHRIEVDLPISKIVSLELIENFVNCLGLKENFRIYKNCKIYYFEKIDIVYYIVYNEEMKEIGRRIEIEARKDYPFKTADEALAEIKDAEQKMSVLGLSAQRRLKKSNWEQFRK